MNHRQSMRYKFRANLIIVVVFMLLFSFVVAGAEIWRLGDLLAKTMSKLYTENMVKGVEAHLSEDLEALSLMADSGRIKTWLAHPDDKSAKDAMLVALERYQNVISEKSIFLVTNVDKRIYFTEVQSEGKWESSGVLSFENQSDQWYFETLQAKDKYNIKVDTDRYLGSMRVWINYKVIENGKVLGVIGTGSSLDVLLNEVFEPMKTLGATSYLIDKEGNVQMASGEQLYDGHTTSSITTEKKSIYQDNRSKEFSEHLKSYLITDTGKDKVTLFTSDDQWNEYAAIAPIKNTNWYVVTIFTITGLINPSHFIPIILLVVLAILMLSFYIDRMVQGLILKPIKKVMDSMQQKNLNVEATLYGIDRGDEIGEFAKGIQQMSDRLVASVPVGLFLIDQLGQITYANPYCLEQLKYSDIESLQGTFCNHPELVFASLSDYENIVQLISSGQSIPTYELELKTSEGLQFWVEFRLTKVTKSLHDWHYEGILLNIQDKKDYEQQLMNMAIKDQLTGLYNRYYFEKVVAEEVKRCDRANMPLSMIIFDLDHFKRINDLYGHDIGDEVLKKVAHVVGSGLRLNDKLVRWGGEEFAILLPDTSEFSAEILAEKLRESVENTKMPVAEVVTASFGIALRMPYEPFTEWFRRVDQALLLAKSSGRNCVKVSQITRDKQTISPVKLIWTEQFNSGNPTIDREHQQLFSMANQLIEYGFETETLGKAMSIYKDITVHIAMHLSHEEDILGQIQYPKEALESHQKIHAKLLEMMNVQSAALSSGKIKPSDAFLRLVEEVVFNHMLVEDLKFFSFIQKQTAVSGNDIERG